MGPVACLLVLLLSVACALPTKQSIRGVHPDYLDHYKGEGGLFRCLDGSATIAFSQVNDDYCDCIDGTDEPGTSACHNGAFYCRNKGYEPRVLAAQFVDDGVCDCCDGSDELTGCEYKCLEKSAAEKEALQKDIQEMEQALAKRQDFVHQAKTKRVEMTQRSAVIDKEIEEQKKAVQVAQDERQRLQVEDDARKAQEEIERKEREEQERLQREEEEKKQQEMQAQQEAEEAQRAFEEAQAQTAEQKQPELELIEAGDDHEQRELLEGSEEEVIEGETAEERGRRIASQWTHDPEAAQVTEGVPEGAGHYDEGHVEGHTEEGAYGEHYEEDVLDPDHEHPHHHHAPASAPGTNSPLQQAIWKLSDEERRLRELEVEKDDLVRYQAYDFGPMEIFLPMAGKCFTSKETRWNYEACWFGKAAQMEGYSNRVNLGTFKRFENAYREAFFGDGDFCTGAGPRSMRLHLECAPEEALHSCEEPGTCMYTCKMDTPLVCTEQDLQVIKKALADIERQEAEILAEIAAEAAAKEQQPRDEL